MRSYSTSGNSYAIRSADTGALLREYKAAMEMRLLPGKEMPVVHAVSEHGRYWEDSLTLDTAVSSHDPAVAPGGAVYFIDDPNRMFGRGIADGVRGPVIFAVIEIGYGVASAHMLRKSYLETDPAPLEMLLSDCQAAMPYSQRLASQLRGRSPDEKMRILHGAYKQLVPDRKTHGEYAQLAGHVPGAHSFAGYLASEMEKFSRFRNHAANLRELYPSITASS